MKETRLPVLCALFVVALPLLPTSPTPIPCTIFMASDGDRVLFGNNEDGQDPFGKIRYVPATKDMYGVVLFSHSNMFIQGGMNDQGLCLDGATVSRRLRVTTSSEKPKPEGSLLGQVLRECASVTEALALYDRYNLIAMEKYQILISDASGDSAIIEGDEVVHKKGDYQVTTNFYHSKTPEKSITCPRYKLVNQLMSEKGRKVTVELMRNALAAAHQEGAYPTQYSNVYDLKQCEVYVYHFHNYNNVVKIDLAAELKKGARTVDLRSLFPKTHAAEVYAARYMRQALAKLKAEAGAWFPTADAINSYAWALLTCELPQFRNPKRALELAKKAVEKSEGKVDRILDTLALAYFKSGSTAKALETQHKAVAVLPPGDSPMRTALEARLVEFEAASRKH